MPIYTELQKYAVSTLRKLRSVRHDQMHWLMERAYPGSRTPAVTEMRRLTHLGKAVNDGTYYYWPGCGLDEDLIAALDIMRRISGDALPVFSIERLPCKLLFYADSGEQSVACRVYLPRAGEERECGAAAETEPHPSNHAVIFCIKNRAQMPLLNIRRSHIFVCPDGHGGYEYIDSRA